MTAASDFGDTGCGPISDGVIADLVSFVRDRAGIVLRDHQEERLRTSLHEACVQFGVGSADAFVRRVKTLPADAPEREFLISRITIGESYFFRDGNQVAFLRDIWLPRLVEQKRKTGQRSLRIWCAGCSDGQEPYTVSMLLQEGMPDLDAWDVNILATDINADALQTATAGRYSAWSFRTTSDMLRNRYFHHDGDMYALNEDVRSRVSFSYLNLVDDSFPSLLNHTAHLDLILCRNVFIYFDRPTVSKVVKKFAACLVPGGHLVVGAADPVELENDGLIYHHNAKAGYFVRGDTDVSPRIEITERPTSTRTPKPRAALEPRVASPKAPAESTLDDLVAAADWQGAIEAIHQLESQGAIDVNLRRAKAKAFANLGALDEALEECVALLEMDSTDKHSQFLLGLVQLDRGDVRAAEKAFRSALFLDRQFIEAHHQLGLTLVRAGNQRAGVKSLNNALSLAVAAPDDQIVHESGGMTMDRLADVLRQAVDIQGES